MRWCIIRATSPMVPDMDGYTVDASAIWSAVSRWVTASVSGKIDSLARGPTTTAPSTVPVPACAKTFTNPSRTPSIFARGLRASGSMLTWYWMPRSRSRPSGSPTVAISGAVKMFAEIPRSDSGRTASPSACDIAMRPCVAATDASGRTPVQSPAA